MKRAFITGVSGFVGAYLARQLYHDGVEVSGLLRRGSLREPPERLVRFGLHGQLALYEGDLTDSASILDALGRARPDVIFHLAAQSYIPRSFDNPMETFRSNVFGTANLLEAVRLKDLDCRIIFAGSSEEYGLQSVSQQSYEEAVQKYGSIFPPPSKFPELPVNEQNFLRPLSPYASSKVQGEILARTYHSSFGMDTLVSRAFNHEGAGRGSQFVTASIVTQCLRLANSEIERVVLGNVNALRDWSHVLDIVDGYILLASKGVPGDVYVQGSMRAHSVLSYLLMTLKELGYQIESVSTLSGERPVEDPLRELVVSHFGFALAANRLDHAMLSGLLAYEAEDRGLLIKTTRGSVEVEFDLSRFRPVDVPIVVSDARKVQKLGFRVRRTVQDIIRDQIDYYSAPLRQPHKHSEELHA